MPALQDRFIRIGSINTRYWVAGNPGSPVILIHPLGGFIEHWLPSFSTLAAHHGSRRVGPDKPARGTRQPAAPGSCTISERNCHAIS